jgi:hypothetical protein
VPYFPDGRFHAWLMPAFHCRTPSGLAML